MYNESFARLVILYAALVTSLHSCIVHPCHMVPHCPLLQCPPLPHRAALSTPANSINPSQTRSGKSVGCGLFRTLIQLRSWCKSRNCNGYSEYDSYSLDCAKTGISKTPLHRIERWYLIGRVKHNT